MKRSKTSFTCNIPDAIHELKYVFKAKVEAQQQVVNSSLDEREREEAEIERNKNYFFEFGTPFPAFTMKHSSVPSYLKMAKFHQFAARAKKLK